MWTYKDIVEYTGQDLKTVQRWYERRKDTGFPEALEKKGNSFIFDEQEFMFWWTCWTYTRRNQYPEWVTKLTINS